MEVVNWPKVFNSLNEAQAFASEFWPELPVYTTLESAKGHMTVMDLRISYDEIFGSSAKVIARLTMAHSDLHHANKQRKDVQADLDNYKRHNVQLGDEHEVLLAKNESLQIDHKQLTDRLTETQSRLYEQSENSTDNFSGLQLELDTTRIILPETLDKIAKLLRCYRAIPLSECPKYEDIYNRTKLENWENFSKWIMGLKMKLAHFGVLHRLHPDCEQICGVVPLADPRCRRIMIASIEKQLVTTVYQNHYSKTPSESFNYMCVTNNTGTQDRFWDAMKRPITFTTTGSIEQSMQ
ncbi:hypothetical protein SARC_05807 [Sphaeroforma arctica JP610]|uniref:Uncharacterized protein n=1 Tax=Sphaeroforma arctica JP610 TaxID=667725 RepID=A0A0L0FZ28_9EUKA|nr:hypothetical protein SARC_05807 [Sphaeroforma arctica JP610]KNC81894.1 hypothetical protein SARC_05807 [Sphaeroforma arctica JP610]|eukprot:XP_014155796.1 hypothetical protein SARC_05807 [Sphaeroforma arctica JP610]